MSKKRLNHKDYFAYSSGSDSDNQCIIKEVSSGRGQTFKSSDRSGEANSSLPDEEEKFKRKYCESSSDSDSEIIRKKFKAIKHSVTNTKKDSVAVRNKARKRSDSSSDSDSDAIRNTCKATKYSKKIYFEDRQGKFSWRDEFNPCEVNRKTHSKTRDYHPDEVYRSIINDDSLIQATVENGFPPCPGLEHVTEIGGLKYLSYFCDLCDKNFTGKTSRQDILHHLRRTKHQLFSLKAFSQAKYEKAKRYPKKERKEYLHYFLNLIQRREGIGKIVVEKEYSGGKNRRAERNAQLSLTAPGTSLENQSRTCVELPMTVSLLPDLARYDYYCLVCECSVNDRRLWASHVRKSRCPTNVRKYPKHEAPKKECELLDNAVAFLTDRVEHDDNIPIVGLSYIREMQHLEDKKETYHCYLCGDCLTCIDIVQHITSLKHRLNYLKRIEHFSLEKVRRLDLNDKRSYYCLTEICRQIEHDEGTGQPEVFVIRKSQ